MKDLNYQLMKLCKANPNGSYATQATRSRAASLSRWSTHDTRAESSMSFRIGPLPEVVRSSEYSDPINLKAIGERQRHGAIPGEGKDQNASPSYPLDFCQ